MRRNYKHNAVTWWIRSWPAWLVDAVAVLVGAVVWAMLCWAGCANVVGVTP